jgi:DNA-binding winged helix-turn-helix (wHTH) protein
MGMRRFSDESPMIHGGAARRPSEAVRLAHEADFRLGQLLVRPSLREASGAGCRVILEPRVMQVLVALARAKGSVVARDELVDACWGGRVVGEDAISRPIGRLRRLARTFPGSFEIETVARVGYRLSEVGATPLGAEREPDRPARFHAALAALLRRLGLH